MKVRYPQHAGTILLCFLVGLLAASCIPASRTRRQSTPFFRPPTAAPQSTVTQSSGQQQGVSQSEPSNQAPGAGECQDNLTFLQDLTIPDGTEVAPQSTMDKRWEVENSGSCNWNENYRVRLVAGPEMNAQKEQALYPARSGTRAVIRILFKAPADPGTYRSAWQAFSAQGEPFGDPFFIEITVK